MNFLQQNYLKNIVNKKNKFEKKIFFLEQAFRYSLPFIFLMNIYEHIVNSNKHLNQFGRRILCFFLV